LNAALAGRSWFHPKDTPWRQMIAKKAEENAAQIRPQIQDVEAPANYSARTSCQSPPAASG
jgi:2-hydroxyacyl-CoA lyase 1